MTHDLVERVTGHRTRLAQEAPQRWHDEEDRSLEDYLVRSSALDRWSPMLLVALPRGWMAIAVAVLAPAFVTGTVDRPARRQLRRRPAGVAGAAPFCRRACPSSRAPRSRGSRLGRSSRRRRATSVGTGHCR